MILNFLLFKIDGFKCRLLNNLILNIRFSLPDFLKNWLLRCFIKWPFILDCTKWLTRHQGRFNLSLQLLLRNIFVKTDLFSISGLRSIWLNYLSFCNKIIRFIFSLRVKCFHLRRSLGLLFETFLFFLFQRSLILFIFGDAISTTSKFLIFQFLFL